MRYCEQCMDELPPGGAHVVGTCEAPIPEVEHLCRGIAFLHGWTLVPLAPRGQHFWHDEPFTPNQPGPRVL